MHYTPKCAFCGHTRTLHQPGPEDPPLWVCADLAACDRRMKARGMVSVGEVRAMGVGIRVLARLLALGKV